GSWNYKPDTKHPTILIKLLCFLLQKFLRIAPALNVSNVNVFRVVLLYEPKSWTLLPPPRNNSMPPGKDANDRK
ncbi:hypothetical protein Gohar_018473, partial [Gossypium harknessii]|nr:hypothetical protein [Gossypium harknessii]